MHPSAYDVGASDLQTVCMTNVCVLVYVRMAKVSVLVCVCMADVCVLACVHMAMCACMCANG